MHPPTRTYRATLEWARNVCDGIMDDAAAGSGRDDYMLLRYEDFAGGAEAVARGVYERCGSQAFSARTHPQLSVYYCLRYPLTCA
jgi:hypothetical protein